MRGQHRHETTAEPSVLPLALPPLPLPLPPSSTLRPGGGSLDLWAPRLRLTVRRFTTRLQSGDSGGSRVAPPCCLPSPPEVLSPGRRECPTPDPSRGRGRGEAAAAVLVRRSRNKHCRVFLSRGSLIGCVLFSLLTGGLRRTTSQRSSRTTRTLMRIDSA